MSNIKTYTIPYECRSLQVSIHPEEWLHAPDHPDYDNTKPSACVMKKRLKSVTVRMLADQVLGIFPKPMWVKDSKAFVDQRSDGTVKDLIIEWYYEGFTLVLERAMVVDPVYGKMSAYAVQRIVPNKLKKISKRASKFKRV